MSSSLGNRLLALAKPHLAVISVAMIALLCGAAINLLVPELIRRALDNDSLASVSSMPWNWIWIFVGLFALQGICFFGRTYLFGIVGHRVVRDLRAKLYDATLRQEIEFFDSHQPGDLVSRLTSDCQMVQNALSVNISVLIRYSFQVLIGVTLMALISLELTGIIVCLLPALIAVSMVLGKRLKALTKKGQAELGAASSLAEESFGAARVVKAFAQEKSESNKFQNRIEAVYQTGRSRSALGAFFSAFVSTLMNISLVGVVLYGLTLLGTDSLSTGALTAFMLYGAIVAISFAFLAGTYADFVQASGAASRIFDILDKPTISVSAGEPLPKNWSGNVRFENLDFAYPSRSDAAVLSKVSFDIPAEKVTALVGPSGAGKSSIVNLILGFYNPISGRILFDKSPSDSLAPSKIREQVAFVPQDPSLFGGTIAENITYGNEEASFAEIMDVCAKANLIEFVEKLPDGLETEVGSKGIQLSGGQKQRIAIARALLTNPKLLILDEATSSLDQDNEKLVQEAIERLMPGRTCLVIAHRLSTIRNADTVIVLEGGAVLQQGTHSSLGKEDGFYRRMIERQELFAAN